MVHLYVLNPAHKLRFISRWLLKGSRRVLKQVNASSPIIDISRGSWAEERQANQFKANAFDFINTNFLSVPQSSLTHDPNYYKDESEGGFCIFRAENTLFKVHKCYLLREPSAFGDMFSLPVSSGSREGLSDADAIPLSDTAEQFQDLLWALYALPVELYPTFETDSPSLERTLNIAQLTHKYCIASYEEWALNRLLSLARNPDVFLRQASPELCARALDIAVLSDHEELLDTLIRRLVPRILWSDFDRQAILQVAENRGLGKIQGVVYYKDLVDLEKAAIISAGDKPSSSHPPFPPETDPQMHDRFIAAHNSFVNLWDCIKASPPHFMEHECPTHLDCLTTWSDLWLAAAQAHHVERLPAADVLGRLKAMMIILRKATRASESISLGCTLAALESLTSAREDIIAGLMDHFQHL